MRRRLHAGAWWLWALGLAAAASRTTNPLLLGLVIAVAAVVVAARGDRDSRTFGAFLRLGLVILAVRIGFEVLFGAPTGGRVLITLPELQLPPFAAGVRLGGPVTAPALLSACYAGLQLLAILACIGAANALADPRRLLKSVPGALYEVGVAVVVALSITPTLIDEVSEVRQARRLRGRADSGVRGAAGSALPVLGAALERSVRLAAAMDSRGYGRSTGSGGRIAGLLTIVGLLGVLVGVYGLLDASAGWTGPPMLLAGVTVAAAGLIVGHRANPRSRYRPDPWQAAEWLVVACGAVPAVVLTVAAAAGIADLTVPVDPPAWPTLPLPAALAIAVAALPARWSPLPARVRLPRPAEAVA
jgi:energy-coupling factor transport system permease protein